MTGKTFDQTSVDVQATPAEPVRPEAFDFEAYADYEESLQERCRAPSRGCLCIGGCASLKSFPTAAKT
ncbi:MAG: hypothetical protein ACYSWW_25595 [Planctomycetota bacterium]